MTTGWLNIGKVGKAHGIRGAFFVRGRDELIPLAYERLRIGDDPERATPVKIKSSRWQGNAPLLTVDGVNDRSTVEKLVGQPIWVERSRVPVDDEDEFLWDDLLGRDVVDEAGHPLGKLVDIYNTGAADIAVIEHADRGQVEIAMVEDYFDFDFSTDGPLRLVVASSMFDDFWQEQK